MAKRSKWKGPLIISSIYSMLTKTSIKTRKRNQLIVPALLGKTIKIYTGKIYISLKITQEMLGYKLGAFSLTKTIKKKK